MLKSEANQNEQNRRYNIKESNPMNRRFSTTDETPQNAQDPEAVPSHRCLILNKSFEALKSARSSTETMKRVQQETKQAVEVEGEKNERYKQCASEYRRFTKHIDDTAHGMASMTNVTKENEKAKQTETTEGHNENHKHAEEDW